jgi:Domain of unknown function (DUF1905)
VRLKFSGEILYWRGPSPFHFVSVPEEESAELRAISSFVSYGWGVIPVSAKIGRTSWTTSLFPKDGGYLVPVKASVREAEGLGVGDAVDVTLSVGPAN